MDEKKDNTFQIVVLGVFVFIGAISIYLFTQIRAEEQGGALAVPVVVWGTIDEPTMRSVIATVAEKAPEAKNIQYEYKDPRFYYGDAIEAFAADKGPDVLLVDQSSILSFSDKAIIIPFETFPERLFLETYVDAASIFHVQNGLLAIPFALNPLVMYWNKDMFAAAGIPKPPRYWDELFPMVEKLTVRTNDTQIVKSAVALGEYSNITNAKAVLSMLLLQAGTPIVDRRNSGLVAVINDKLSFPTVPGIAALQFYTEFSNPTRTAYSWNRSLKPSRDAFLSGELAIYFDFAGEYETLMAINPNANFDVAPVPQARTASLPATYANISGFIITKASKNPGGAYAAATLLSSATAGTALMANSNLGTVRRDLVLVPQPRAVGAIARDAALTSRTWIEPSAASTDRIFARMIDVITSGRMSISEALRNAQEELENVLE